MQVFAPPKEKRKKFSYWSNAGMSFVKSWLSNFYRFGAIKLKTKLRICKSVATPQEYRCVI